MKFVDVRPFVDPDAAVRKLVEIVNATEAVQDGRIYIERINGSFLERGWLAGPVRRRPHPRDQVGVAVAARVRHLCEVHFCRCPPIRLIAS
jgi:hypothetical protein